MEEQKPPNMKDHPKLNRNVQFTWKQAVATTSLCASILGFWYYKRDASAIAKVEETSVGTPQLGGPWTLTNQSSETVSDTDMLGKYQLIYFGFTFCPDVCPEELQKMGEVVEKLDKKYGPIVQPIFITVDPARDTAPQMATYCAEFHPRLIGLTGTEEQIRQVSRLFRVYYNTGIKLNDEDYLIDHSIIIYLMDKNGKFLDFFGKNLTASEITDKMVRHIEKG